MNDRIDLDPRPSRSPRLYAEVEAVPRSRPTSDGIGSKLSMAKTTRMRRMAIIFACRQHTPPVPYSTLIVTLKISERQAIRLYKLACRRNLRQSRV